MNMSAPRKIVRQSGKQDASNRARQFGRRFAIHNGGSNVRLHEADACKAAMRTQRAPAPDRNRSNVLSFAIGEESVPRLAISSPMETVARDARDTTLERDSMAFHRAVSFLRSTEQFGNLLPRDPVTYSLPDHPTSTKVRRGSSAIGGQSFFQFRTKEFPNLSSSRGRTKAGDVTKPNWLDTCGGRSAFALLNAECPNVDDANESCSSSLKPNFNFGSKSKNRKFHHTHVFVKPTQKLINWTNLSQEPFWTTPEAQHQAYVAREKEFRRKAYFRRVYGRIDHQCDDSAESVKTDSSVAEKRSWLTSEASVLTVPHSIGHVAYESALRAKSQVDAMISPALSFSDVEISTRHVALDAITKVIAVLNILSQSTCVEDFIANILSILGLVSNPEVLAIVDAYVFPKKEIVKQSSAMDFREMVLKMKASVSTPDSIPGFNMLKKGIMLAAAMGVHASGAVHETGILKAVFQGWEVQGLSLRNVTLVDYALDIALFTHEMYEMCRRGMSVTKMLLPRTLGTRFAELHSLLQFYRTGRLSYEEHGMDNDRFIMEVNGLVFETSTSMAQLGRMATFAETEAAKRLHSSALHLKSEVAVSGIDVSPRRAPFAIVIYGDTSLGKTTAVTRVRNFFGSLGGFGYSAQRNTFNINGNDAYESGLHGQSYVAVADDAGNQKDFHAMKNFLAICNNAPMASTQAEADLKGKIYYKFRLAVATTNFKDARIKDITHAPGSLLRRPVWIEISCPENDSKKFNTSRVYDDQNQFIEQQWVQEYTWDFDSATSQNYRSVAVGEKVPLSVWLNGRGRKLYEDWEQGQDNYIKTCESERDFEACEHGSIRHICPVCKVLEPIEKQFVAHRALTQMGVGFIHSFTNVVMPYADRLYGGILPKLIVNTASEFAWDVMCRTFSADRKRTFVHAVIFVFTYSLFISVLSFACLSPSALSLSLAFISLFVVSFFVWSLRRACRSYVSRRVRESIGGPSGILGCLVLGHLGTTYLMARRIQGRMMQQSLEVSSVEQIKERQAEPNRWKNIFDVEPALTASTRLASMTLEQMSALVLRYVARVEAKNASGVVYRTLATRIGPREIIVPAHWASEIFGSNPDAVLTINRSSKKSTAIPYAAAVEEVRYHEIADLALLVTTESVGTTSLHDLISAKYPARPVAGILLTKDAEMVPNPKEYASCTGRLCPSSTQEKDAPSAPAVLYDFGFSPGTVKGDCGAPLLSRDFPHAILGFHVGGGRTTGVAHVGNYDGFKCSAPAVVGSLSQQSFEQLPRATPLDVTNIEGDRILPNGTDFDPRSIVRFIPEDAMSPTTIIGASPGIIVAPKTDIRATGLGNSLEELGVPCKFEAPKINANRSASAYMQVALDGMTPIAPSIVTEACNSIVSHFLKNVAPDHVPDCTERTIHHALNGIPGNKFARPMKITTAAGLMMPGKKSKYVEIEQMSDGNRTLHPVPELEEMVNTKLARYHEGKQSIPIIRTACKDEPVMKEEYAGKKKIVRQFMVVPFDYLVIGRILFGNVVELVSAYPLVLGFLHGCNINTEDWTEMYEYYVKKRENSILEGDFSKWDVRLSGQLMRAAGSIYIRIASHFGISTSQQLAMRTYVEDLVGSVYNFAGVGIQHSGWNPSGHGFTIDWNAMCNLLVHVSAYSYTARTLEFRKYPNFFEHVRMGFMGDDSFGSSTLKWFNMQSMLIFCTDHRMKYTAGNKQDIESMVFLEDGSKVSFCKRTWRWDARKGLYDAPLDIDSIMKPFFLRTRNPSLSNETYLIELLRPTAMELSRHGHEIYDEYMGILGQAFKSENIWHADLMLSYGEVCFMLDEHYRLDTRKQFGAISVEPGPNVHLLGTSIDSIPVDNFGFQSECCDGLPTEVDENRSSRKNKVLPLGFPSRFTYSMLACVCMALGLSCCGSTPLTPRSAVWDYQRKERIDPGSIKKEIITHASESPGHGMANLGIGSAVQGADGLDNVEMLQRELKIRTIEWRVDTPEFVQFNPWEDLLNEPVIANRLAHFTLLSCMGLELRFTLSGSPFSFGRMMCSYQPLHTVDDVTLIRSGQNEDLVAASQRPHIYLNPTSSDGGTLNIPYNYPAPFFQIIDRDWDKAGLVTVTTLNQLQYASARSESITINVFCRLIAPSIEIGTSRLPPLAQQMMRAADMSTGEGDSEAYSLALKPSKTVARARNEVMFQELAAKGSYFHTFEWGVNQIHEEHLFSMEVTPQMYRRFGDEIHMTPSCWVTTPFEYWRGFAEVTLELVASGLHRGKLIMRWDPNGFDDAKRDKYHLGWSVEVDLTETTTKTVKMGWGKPLAFSETADIQAFDADCFSTSPNFMPRRHSNGTLSIYVQQALTAPEEGTSQTVYVNLYTRCHELEVSSLTPRNLMCTKPRNTKDSDTSNGPQGPTNDQSGFDDVSNPPTDSDSNFTDTNPPVVSPPQPDPDPAPPSPPPPAVNNISLPGDTIMRTGDGYNQAGANPRWVHTDNSGTNTGTYWVYFDGITQPELTFSVTSAENNWNPDFPPTITTSVGTVSIPGDGNDPVDFSPILPIFSGPPGWREVPYTSKVQNQRRIVYRKCVLMGFIDDSGYFTINSETESDWNESLGNGLFGAKFPLSTTFTFGNKVPSSPITFAAPNSFTVNGTTYPGGVSTILIDGDTAVITGNFTEIGYAYDLQLQSEIVHQSEEIIQPDGDQPIPESAPTEATIGSVEEPMSELQIAFGEKTEDWVAVLKRFTSAYVLRGNDSSVSAFFPQYPISTIRSTNAYVTPVRNSLFEYVAQAYLGVRGGMNIKFVRDPRGFGELKHRTFSVDRIPATQQIVGSLFDSPRITPGMLSGTAMSNDILQAGLDVLFPQYTPYRYYAARSIGYEGVALAHTPGTAWFRGWLSQTEGVLVAYNVAHDFSLVNFISVPVMERCPP